MRHWFFCPEIVEEVLIVMDTCCHKYNTDFIYECDKKAPSDAMNPVQAPGKDKKCGPAKIGDDTMTPPSPFLSSCPLPPSNYLSYH
jgi:hypothetical protein